MTSRIFGYFSDLQKVIVEYPLPIPGGTQQDLRADAKRATVDEKDAGTGIDLHTADPEEHEAAEDLVDQQQQAQLQESMSSRPRRLLLHWTPALYCVLP